MCPCSRVAAKPRASRRPRIAAIPSAPVVGNRRRRPPRRRSSPARCRPGTARAAWRRRENNRSDRRRTATRAAKAKRRGSGIVNVASRTKPVGRHSSLSPAPNPDWAFPQHPAVYWPALPPAFSMTQPSSLLIVDADLHGLETLTYGFEREGCKVTRTSDLSRAVQLSRTGSPALSVVMMREPVQPAPGRDRRASGAHRGMPILALGGNARCRPRRAPPAPPSSCTRRPSSATSSTSPSCAPTATTARVCCRSTTASSTCCGR